MNPMAQILMPLCQSIIAGMAPQPKIEKGLLAPMAIQLDEDFAAMAERYFDNIYDGRMETPHQLVELIRKYSCCGHHEPDMAREKHEHTEHASWGDKAPHRVFMKALDEMNEKPAMADAILDKHFHGLTDDERRVLKQAAKSPSTAVHARAVNMEKELYIQRLESAMYKIKNE